MKKGFEKALILSLSIAIVLLTAAGCQKQTTTTQKGTIKAADKAGKQVVIKTEAKQTSDKTAKTTGAENIELKKQLAAKDSQIESLKKALEKYEAEKAAMEKEMDSIGEETFKVFEENMKLQDDVNNLKMHIEQIEAENKPK
jgi:chromosome segregation ATPase